jgi:hypothetical protein
MVQRPSVGWFADVLTVLEGLGIKKTLMSLIGGLGMLIWSWVAKLGGPTAVVYGLVSAAALLFILLVVSRLRGTKATIAVGEQLPGTLQQVQCRTFRNEMVPLDGFDYTDCDFHQCALQYNGGSYRFANCRFHGFRGVGTTVAAIRNTFDLCAAVGMMPDVHMLKFPIPKPPS